MNILNSYREWFENTGLYRDFLANLPEGLNNVYLDAIIILILAGVVIAIICQAVSNIIFRLKLKRKNLERENARLQLEKERLEMEKNSLRSAEEQRLYLQFMQYMMINQMSGMTFEQWKQMNQSNITEKELVPKQKAEIEEPVTEETEISESVEETESAEEESEKIFESELEQKSEMQVDELLPESELVDEPEEESAPDIVIPSVQTAEAEEEPEEEIPKEIVDVAAIMAEKQKEIEEAETQSDSTNNFEQMIASIIQHKNDVEQQKELDEEMSKITEQNMAVLDEKFTSGLHMETEDIEKHEDQMTDDQIKELEKTRKKIEKEEEKKRRAANRKPLFGKKKDKTTEGNTGNGK